MNKELIQIGDRVKFHKKRKQLDSTQQAFAGCIGTIILKELCANDEYYYEVSMRLFGTRNKILSAYAKRFTRVRKQKFIIDLPENILPVNIREILNKYTMQQSLMARFRTRIQELVDTGMSAELAGDLVIEEMDLNNFTQRQLQEQDYDYR